MRLTLARALNFISERVALALGIGLADALNALACHLAAVPRWDERDCPVPWDCDGEPAPWECAS